ncbi:MAG: hypothetical protein JWQ04_1181 [Pedosphaera sp.]|nr:hypothetical protein [Pedosphaera sp.]
MEVFFKNLTPEEVTPEKLLHDLSVLGENTEEFFRISQGQLAEKSKEKFLKGLEQMKATCHNLQEQVGAGHGWNAQTERGFPYVTMAIVFGLGMLTAALTVRRPSQCDQDIAVKS